jgi:hypothetical protein
MHKSAGLTFLHSVLEATGLSKAPRHGGPLLDCDVGGRATGWDPARRTCVLPPSGDGAANVRVLFNGYVPSLAEHPTFARPRFTWMTAVREPTARLVSAYLYCKLEQHLDPLCGYEGLDARRASFPAFARHWGNYLLRELLLYPPLLREVLPAPLPAWAPRDAAWLHLKRHLNGSDDVATPRGKASLERVAAVLRGGQLYDVLLVVERTRFNQSCALLDAALPLQPEVRPSAWCALLSKHTVTHASERYKEQEHELMASAKQDAVVQKAIAGDVRLWKETVLPLFDKRVGKLKVR